MQTPPKSRQNPASLPEEKPILQFLQDSESDLTLKIDDIHPMREYVKHLPVTLMRPIHAGHLESLVNSDPNTWPPIYVTLTNVGYVCFDGYYRIQASKVLQTETIKARSMPVKNLNDLIEARFRANLKHGLPASEATRSDYCYWLHLTYPTLSQRQIATRVGVAVSTVSRAIERREKEHLQQPSKATQTLEEAEEEKDKQIQEFTKSTGKFLRSTIRILKTVKPEEYDDFVWNLQAELLNGPEDKQALLRISQFLSDVARSKRKAKITV
jgi:hypothetical protein